MMVEKSHSPPYRPEHNSIAERVNRTVEDAARSILIQAKLPECLWPFALKHVMYVRNRVPHSTTGTTPYTLFTGEKPDLKHIKVFGCAAYVLRLPRPSKFEARAYEGVYLETLQYGSYRVLAEKDGGFSVLEFRHVTFD